jgi:Mn2+/Fe2+ NRAMP family transporter
MASRNAARNTWAAPDKPRNDFIFASKASRYAAASSICLVASTASFNSSYSPSAAFSAFSQPYFIASKAGLAPFIVSCLNSSNLSVKISTYFAALCPFNPSNEMPNAVASSFNYLRDAPLARLISASIFLMDSAEVL